MKRIVVSGGGLIGIFSALMAARNGNKVILIEKNKNIGGLLSSFERNGAIYDYGTHVPANTQIKEIDDILFGSESDINEDWYKIDYLTAENFFEGKWCETSPLPDATSLPEDTYMKGIVQLLNTKNIDGKDNLGKYLDDNFGEIFKNEIYAKILSKLQGKTPDELHIEVLRTFGLGRVIGFKEEVTKRLKALPEYDRVLGFNSYIDGDRSGFYLYPKGNNGIGKWIKLLEKKLEENSVEIVTEHSINKINHENNKIDSIELDNGRSIELDELVWTTPLFFAFNAASIEPPKASVEFRTTTLVHLRYKEQLLKTFPQYLLNWDKDYLSYRLTLYPNITTDKDKSSVNNITIEVLSDNSAKDKQEEIEKRIIDEMVQLNIVSKDNEVIDSMTQYLGPTFPVFNEDFINVAIKQNEVLSQKLTNFIPLGRGTGKAFFINDLLVQAYENLKDG